MLNVYENEFNSWIDKEKKAIELINVVGKLWFDRSIELLLFRKPLLILGAVKFSHIISMLRLLSIRIFQFMKPWQSHRQLRSLI